MVEAPCKAAWQLLIKLYRELAYEPAIILLSIQPREMKTYVHTKTCAKNVCRSCIHNSQKLETAHVSINCERDTHCSISMTWNTTQQSKGAETYGTCTKRMNLKSTTNYLKTAYYTIPLI